MEHAGNDGKGTEGGGRLFWSSTEDGDGGGGRWMGMAGNRQIRVKSDLRGGGKCGVMGRRMKANGFRMKWKRRQRDKSGGDGAGIIP
jgi:hypothetical protein